MSYYTDDSKINKTVGIRPELWDAVVANEIKNFSRFVNELLEDALTDKKLQKVFLIKRLTTLQKEFNKAGYTLEVNIVDDVKESN